MKKERIVALCIGVVLWGSFQSVCSVAVGAKLFQASAHSLALRSNLVPAIICAGWPPLGFLYGEMRLIHSQKKEFPVHATKPVGDRAAGDETPKQWSEYDNTK